MKIVISTLCGEMLARKEDTILPPLLKILSQQADVAGIPNTLTGINTLFFRLVYKEGYS